MNHCLEILNPNRIISKFCSSWLIYWALRNLMPGAKGAVAVLKFCARKIIPTRLPDAPSAILTFRFLFLWLNSSIKIIPCSNLLKKPSGGRSTRRIDISLTSSLGLVGDQVNLAEGIPCVVVDGLAAGQAGLGRLISLPNPTFTTKLRNKLGDSPIK